MAIKGQKFTLELPTISDVASVFKVRETGVSNDHVADSAGLLYGLQTGEVQSVTIPGVGNSPLSMIKKQLHLSVPGKDWIAYEIEWEEPVNTDVAFNAVVEQVNDQCGPNPATCSLTKTGITIPSETYALGVAVSITHRGATIFRGWVTDIDYSSSTGQSGSCIMNCQDVRWLMSGIFIGGRAPIAAGYKPDDLSEIVFNKGGLPNRDPNNSTFLFAPGGKGPNGAGVMWNYGNAINALLTWYNADSKWKFTVADIIAGLPHAAVIMPETALTGQTLLSALDQLISAGSEISWRIDPTQNPSAIEIITTSSGAARTINYRTGTIDTSYSTNCNVRKSVAGGYKTAEVHSAKIILESYFPPTDWTMVASEHPEFSFVFALKASAITTRLAAFTPAIWDGQVLIDGSVPYRFVRNLVTRQHIGTSGAGMDGATYYLANEITDVVLADDLTMVLDPWIWASIDSGTTLKYCIGGVEIDYDYGRIFAGRKTGTTTAAPLPTIEERAVAGLDLTPYLPPSTAFKIAATVAVELDLRYWLTGNFAGFTWGFTRNRVVKLDQIAAEFRIKTKMPAAASPFSPDTELIPNGEMYVNPTSKITDFLSQVIAQNPGILYSCGATAPFAPLMYPGDRLVVTNFSKWPVGKTIYVTQTGFKIVKGKISLNVSGSNQFWQENAHMTPDPMVGWNMARLIQKRFLEGYNASGGR